MHLNPRNRHLNVEIIDQGEEESPFFSPDDCKPKILLPDDYMPIKEEYALVRLIDWAPDCNGIYLDDDILVVKQNMIEEIKAGGEIFYLVLENYVMGILDEENEINCDKSDVN